MKGGGITCTFGKSSLSVAQSRGTRSRNLNLWLFVDLRRSPYVPTYPVESVWGHRCIRKSVWALQEWGPWKLSSMKTQPICLCRLPSKLLLAGKAPGKSIVAASGFCVCGCKQIVWFVYTENRYEVLITWSGQLTIKVCTICPHSEAVRDHVI